MAARSAPLGAGRPTGVGNLRLAAGGGQTAQFLAFRPEPAARVPAVPNTGTERPPCGRSSDPSRTASGGGGPGGTPPGGEVTGFSPWPATEGGAAPGTGAATATDIPGGPGDVGGGGATPSGVVTTATWGEEGPSGPTATLREEEGPFRGLTTATLKGGGRAL